MLHPHEWNPNRHNHLSRARDQCFRQYNDISKTERNARMERSSRLVDRARGDTSVTEENLESLREIRNDLEIEKDRRFLLATILAHACHPDPGVALRAIKSEVDSSHRAFHLMSHEAVDAVERFWAGGAGGEFEAISSAGGGVEIIEESETEPKPKKKPRRGDRDNSNDALGTL